MKLYSENEQYKLYQGNMLDVLEVIESNSIDSIVTDPPYELNFMNKGWDNSGIAFQKETWEKCYEILKPGGYLLAFGGSRTFHRIACAIEDAGFEIRDTIIWLYGSGFPKSMDISKQLDKNANSEMLGIIGKWLKQKRENCNLSREDVANIINLTPSAIYNWEENPKKYGFPTKENWNKIKKIYNFDGTWDDFKKEAEREVIGTKKVMGKDTTDIYGKYKGGEVDITIPSTDLAKQWQGWGTALKPSFEPIIVARKPFKGSLVDNVIEYGVGGINIDECRVFGNDKEELQKNWVNRKAPAGFNGEKSGIYGSGKTDNPIEYTPNGRFPANTILTYDETDFDEVCGGFPNTKGNGNVRHNNNDGKGYNCYSNYGNCDTKGYDDSGSASRYFYCAKASKKDRDEGLEEFKEVDTTELLNRKANTAGILWEQGGTNAFSGAGGIKKNTHPTVKPTDLMQYLVRLVTPNNGIVLDPFNGSGSTGKAIMYENRERDKNYKYIGIELTEEYLPISKARIEYVCNLPREDKQITIFDFMGETNE